MIASCASNTDRPHRQLDFTSPEARQALATVYDHLIQLAAKRREQLAHEDVAVAPLGRDSTMAADHEQNMKSVLIAMIAACAVALMLSGVAYAASPIIQQTGPISTTYIGEGSGWYYQNGCYPYCDWGLGNYFTPTVPESTTLVGLITELRNVTYSGAVDMRWSPLSSGASSSANGDPTYWRACGQYETDSGACNAVGYESWWAPMLHDPIQVAGWAQWGYGHWYAQIYPIYRGYIAVPECGQVITDTHFVYNSWTPYLAGWTYSVFDIPPVGNIHKTGSFTQTGTYSVTVWARSNTTTATLTVNLGASYGTISVTRSLIFSQYTTQISVTVGGDLNVQLTVPPDSADNVQVDRICLSVATPSALSCSIIQDPDFHIQDSWAGFGSAIWSSAEGGAIGVWVVGVGSVVQPIPDTVMSTGGTYSITVIAKADADTTVSVWVDNATTPAGYVTITASSNYEHFTGEFTVDGSPNGGAHQFAVGRTAASGSLILDYVCVYVMALNFPSGPCGMTPAMVQESLRYIRNSDFSDGLHFPWPNIIIGFPLGLSVPGFDDGFAPSNWYYGGITGGVYRVREGGGAIGIVPIPMHSGIRQEFHSTLNGGYNVFMRAKRNYANANLIIGNANKSTMPVGAWADVGFYFVGGTGIPIQTNCIDLNSGSPAFCVDGVDNHVNVVDVDDVYVVPGPAIECGVVITQPITPPGDCLNPNSSFTLGAASWTATGGAQVLLNEAHLPANSSIFQYVPEVSGGNWGQLNAGIIVGHPYSISIGARVQSTANSLRVTIGEGATPLDPLDTFEFNSTDMAQVWEGSFTPEAAQVSGSGIGLRVTAKDGGTIIVYFVCIRNNGNAPLPPSGCLGTWHASSGGPALGSSISASSYVYNGYELIAGTSYTWRAGGAFDTADSGRLTVVYVKNSVQQYSGTPVVATETGGAFNVSQTFIAPGTFGEGGELRLIADTAVTYSDLCLTESGNAPPITPPGPLPYPECRNENGVQIMPEPQSGFFMMPKYDVTNAYTGTADTPAAYMAELAYNYAIYPLVCTQISIANWQYMAYKFWISLWATFPPILWWYLDQILDAIKAFQFPNLDWIWTIIKMIIWILVKIMVAIGSLVSDLFEGLRSIVVETKSYSGLAFPIDCEGENQWMCFGLAGLLAAENEFGNWLTIVANIVVAILTIHLAFWVIGQMRAMFQPGAGDDSA